MSKSVKQLMAEYIRNGDCDSCKVCVLEKQCNEKYALAEEKGESYEPNECDCINGIINYFERQKCKS